MKMGLENAGVVFLIVSLLFAQGSASVQYINANFRGNSPCQNVPLQRNIPIRLPLSANSPLANNWIPNVALNKAISLPNTCPCNVNNAPIFNERLSAKDRSKLIANLKMVLSNLLPIAEKLALLSNLALATRNVASQAANLNLPMRKLNVPIVNDVPIGALRVARNLPLNFLADNNPSVSNNIQVLGKGPVNYQNVAGTPLNNIARLALNNLRNVPLNNLLNSVTNVPSNNFLNNVPNVPFTNFFNSAPNMPINPGYSVNNIINNDIERRFILYPPCNNIPCNNVPSITLNNLLEKIQMARNLNLPVNKLPLPIDNFPLAINNLPLPINNQIRVNTVTNPTNFNLPAQNTIRYINTASPPISNNRLPYEQILGSSNAGQVTNVPVIPSQTLANLPAYNGLPVIRVSESVYRLTPVDNML